MSLNLGYLISTAIFAVIFLIAVSAQISATRFRPVLYWVTIVATTTVGTTLADFATGRSVSAMPVEHRYYASCRCSHWQSGIERLEPYRLIP